MSGGDGELNNVEYELNKINDAYGAKMFRAIYQNLCSTMKSCGTSLSQKSAGKIESQLKQLEEIEKEIIKTLSNVATRKMVYDASNGQVVIPDGLDDQDALRDILKKTLSSSKS